jgi:hypothetical protein
MEINQKQKFTGILLIVVPLIIQVFYILLIMTFDYPEILREDPSYILEQYYAGGVGMRLIWLGFALGLFLIIPLTIILHYNIASLTENTEISDPILVSSSVFGILAGTFDQVAHRNI